MNASAFDLIPYKRTQEALSHFLTTIRNRQKAPRTLPLLAPPRHPDVPGHFRHAEQQTALRRRQPHFPRAAQAGQRLLRMVEMINRERCAFRVPGLAIQPLPPDATETVALREEIQ